MQPSNSSGMCVAFGDAEKKRLELQAWFARLSGAANIVWPMVLDLYKDGYWFFRRVSYSFTVIVKMRPNNVWSSKLPPSLIVILLFANIPRPG